MNKTKTFNITGPCIKDKHYMVDTTEKVQRIIEEYIDPGEYITINKARQYGKTTTLECLYQALKTRYIVIDISFEGKEDYFTSMQTFAEGFSMDVADCLRTEAPGLEAIFEAPVNKSLPMRDISNRISGLCAKTGKDVLLFIDEVDKAADNDVFLTFLGILRDKYIDRQRGRGLTFKSVVLAGVHDIKNIKMKLRPEEEHQYNSPWNIAAKFELDMSFHTKDIASMLCAYEEDYHTGMDIEEVAKSIYYYTEGYPFLVSDICKTLHDNQLSWDLAGVTEAEKRIVKSNNTLFDDLIKNLTRYTEFRTLVERILLRGAQIAFEIRNPGIDRGLMYGIFKESDSKVKVSNIIFETVIFNYFISLIETGDLIGRYTEENSQFVSHGALNMELVLQKFKAFMYAEYRDEDSAFIEQHGRLIFLSFLKPIINGTGHYVVEPQTRGNRRMDIVVFYGSEEHIVELKLWRGKKAEDEGVEQLADYLRFRGQKKGYLLSFCDNKKTPRQDSIVHRDDVEIMEVVVAYRDKK